MQQQQSRPFSFRKTFRQAFHASAEDNQATSDSIDPVSSVPIGGGRDVAMSVIETSLAALKEGSALIRHAPFVGPVAGLILQVLQMRDEVKQFKPEWDAVMEKLTDIASIVIDVGKSCEEHGLVEGDLPEGVRNTLKSLYNDLNGIEAALKQCADAGVIKRVLLRNDMLQKVKKYDAKLSNVLQNFLAKLLLDARLAQIVEKRKAVPVTQAEATISPRILQGPTVPQIFFGRDAELAQIIHMVTTNIGSRPARLAILGPGGYGKTTLARAVLTVDIIRERFGDARYFVACEPATSSGTLLSELGKALGVLDGTTEALWSRIREMLTVKDSIICFDNFESPWDQDAETKQSVEELLSRVTELREVTVLITMRGVERPSQTFWTQPFLEPLGILGHDAAKEIWQAIAGNYDDFSEKLIRAVDHVPLAVGLLSHLSQVTPPALLWEEWNLEQLKAVQIGQMHRLSNLEYSIQLSVNSKRMGANPLAKNLLGVLSMLPDGLHVKQISKFKDMLDINIISCLQTLLQCSLIKLIEERYQPHPIVRHFCLNQGMVLLAQKTIIQEFYITLALSNCNMASLEAYKEMVSEVNNTKATLIGLLNSNYKDQSKLINASINFTGFCITIGDLSDAIINQSTKFVEKNNGTMELQIECLRKWGEVCYFANDFENSLEKLKKAEKLCLSGLDANPDLCGDILSDLGDTYRLLNALNDAEICFQKALNLFKDSKNTIGQGILCAKLGYLYRQQNRLDEAITLYETAIQHQKVHSHPISLGNTYEGLGQVYKLQKKFSEAENALNKALKNHKAANSSLGQGNDHSVLGEVYFQLGKIEDAITTCQKALEFYKVANDILGQGNSHTNLGDIYYFQDMLNEAENSYKRALELHIVAKHAWGQGNDFHGLGRVYMKRGQLYDAKDMFEKAMSSCKKGQSILLMDEVAECLNIVLDQLK